MELPSDWSERPEFMAAAETIVIEAVMAVLRHEGEDAEDCEVGILITEDETIRDLNRTYRDIDAPTDVLAFAMREGVDGELHPEMLGDLVLSVPTATRQATEEGHSLARELAFLSIHGTLHLLGYDHDVDDREAEMRARERAIMEALTRSEEWPDWESRLLASMRD